MGFLPVNAFVIKAAEPVLVDTGMGIDGEQFMAALKSVIDPAELRWLWLTHDDADHTGNIEKVLDAAPSARLAANALGTLRMSTVWQVPMDRCYWLNPGDSISVGDRKLTAIRPPTFDNPTTIGLYDDNSQAFFSADSFGAITSSQAQDADEIREDDLSQGMTVWGCADTPWVHMVEPIKFNQGLDKIRQIDPQIIFSSHLAPARNKTKQFLKLLETLPTCQPFVPPNQAALEGILAQMRDKRTPEN